MVKIQINKIWLDKENPRHDVFDNQAEITKTLIENENIKNLVLDIYEFDLSPLDNFAVIPLKGRKNQYVSIEGNRRLCAIKLLNDPERCFDSSLKSILKKLLKERKGVIPKELDCVIFDSRDDALHWLSVRHGGEKEGVGPRSWKAPQKTRFNERNGIADSNILSHHLLDYGVDKNIISDEQRNLISITTLTRYLSNPIFRNTFGISDRHKFETKLPPSEFKKGVRRFLHDTIKGMEVNSRTNKNDREKYANKLIKENVIDSSKMNDEAISFLVNSNNRGSKVSGRSSQHPDKRKYLIPSEFRLNSRLRKLQRIYYELKEINVGNCSNAVAVLLRMFIEIIFREYAKKKKLKGISEKGKLHIVIGKVANDLEKHHSVRPNILKPLRVASSDKHSLLSPETFGEYVHGVTNPIKKDLIRTWDSYESAIKEVLKYI